MKRSMLYVDGFNFYYGVTDFWRKEGRKQSPEKKLAGLGWCDFRALVERHFLNPNQEKLVRVKYFTSEVKPKDEVPTHRVGERHRYLEWDHAVRTIEGIEVIRGFHRTKESSERYIVRHPENPDTEPKFRMEKQNEVNMAVEMLLDTLAPQSIRPEKVYVLSADSDLMPAIMALAERLQPRVDVTVLLPSDANEREWREVYEDTRDRFLTRLGTGGLSTTRTPGRAIDCRVLTTEVLAQSLLPYEIATTDGKTVRCRDEWQLTGKFLKDHCKREEWLPFRNHH